MGEESTEVERELTHLLSSEVAARKVTKAGESFACMMVEMCQLEEAQKHLENPLLSRGDSNLMYSIIFDYAPREDTEKEAQQKAWEAFGAETMFSFFADLHHHVMNISWHEAYRPQAILYTTNKDFSDMLMEICNKASDDNTLYEVSPSLLFLLFFKTERFDTFFRGYSNSSS